jgi:hypothetical protein
MEAPMPLPYTPTEAEVDAARAVLFGTSPPDLSFMQDHMSPDEVAGLRRDCWRILQDARRARQNLRRPRQIGGVA